MLTYLQALLVSRFGKFLPKSEKGQDAAEYALLIGLIALVIVVAVGFLGTSLSTTFSNIGSRVATWGT